MIAVKRITANHDYKKGKKGEQEFNALMKHIENTEVWNEAYKILA